MSYAKKERVTVNKTVTCTGNGDTLISIFSLKGIIRIHEIFGVVTEATNTTVFQKVGLVLYEATPTTVEITDIGTGVDGSGTVDGSLFIRDAVAGASSPLAHKEASVCSSLETQYDGAGYGLVLVQRSGVPTNVKVEFTGDADTDVDVCFYATYTPLSSGSALTAV